jgi:FtsP/CotA-like multicopper oxidase with cupredoxin domain
MMIHKNVRLACIASVWFLGGPVMSGVAAAAAATVETVTPNDNTRAAGVMTDGALTLRLRAARGSWRPEGPDGPALSVEALGEASSGLTVPAPLIRVAEGTPIVVSIQNDLDASLHVNGLCTRDGTPCPAVDVPAGGAREVRFSSGRAGTYHYWATTIGAPVPFRELAGGFVVDPPGAAAADRVLVITEWTNLTRDQLLTIITADDPSAAFVALKPRVTFVINGLSWPATERMTYRRGEPVRWRVINLSSQAHPLHLHGFYFDVISGGDGWRDSVFDPDHVRRVVTQLVPSGGTMAMTWTPEREGNWLFHCHIMHHVSPARRLAAPAASHAEHGMGQHAEPHNAHDSAGGMAGMILGVTVLAPAGPEAPPPSADRWQRKLTLTMERGPSDEGGKPTAGFVLRESGIPAAPASISAPGPAIVLRRSEPVEITVVNRLPEATALHWHGMELDSYYDGVHGWSGMDQRLAPMIEPGGTFVVRITPPRAGTFIYHTHLHDYRQLSSGLYGPLIVVDNGETFNPATDHVMVIGRRGLTSENESILGDPASVVLNGERAPRFVWKSGTSHRIRLVNITPDDIFTVSLQTTDGPATWKPLTKDGATVPGAESILGPARQTIAVGETYDFEYQTVAGKAPWLEVRSLAGRWQVQGQVIVK